MHYDTQSTPAGYVHNQRPGALAELAANYTQRTGCAPVFLFSQEVSLDPKAALDTISLHLYNRGITAGTKVHTVSLLVLLSSGKNQREMLYSILQLAQNNDGVVFLEDAYRYDYDRARAFALFENLQQEYLNPKPRCPLVMKAPPPSDRQLFYSCPSFRRNCFHLSLEPVSMAGAPASRAKFSFSDPVKSSPLQQQQTQSRREPPKDVFQSKAPKTPPRRGVAWYRADQQLLKQEYDGLLRFLSQKNLSYQMEKPDAMPNSGRLRIRVQLDFQELGRCTLIIIYANHFQKNLVSAVSIAISGYDASRIKKRLSLVDSVYDNELGGHLFSPNRNSRTIDEYGVAAATVNGFIRAMM